MHDNKTNVFLLHLGVQITSGIFLFQLTIALSSLAGNEPSSATEFANLRFTLKRATVQ